MKANVKYYHSPDAFDLEMFCPVDEESFSFLLQVMVGVKNKEGAESFDIVVCTPKWLLENHKKDEVLFGYQKMIVFEYDFHRIKHKIEKYIDGLYGNNWEELANKINMIGHWEFDGYTE